MIFINVEKYGFVVEPRYYLFGWARSAKILGVEKLVKQLVQARKYLPKGYNFKIWDCKRTIKTQILMSESIRKRLKVMHSKSSPKEIADLVNKYCGAIRKDPRRKDIHQNGGAVDLTILNSKGEELYMGTDHDDLTAKAETNYYENIKSANLLQKEARKNRRILKNSLTKASFKNYSVEWWHWSSNG